MGEATRKLPFVEEETKKCPKCKEIKPISEYHKTKSRLDGLSWSCKHCSKYYVDNIYNKVSPSTDTKTCKKCGKTKHIGEFHYNRTCKDGIAGNCKKCHYFMSKKRRAKNPEARNKYEFEWRKKNPEKFDAIQRKYKLRKYGMTQEDYKERLKSQGFSCAVCGSKSPGRSNQSFNVDHDHNTGLVRGLLCHHCNLAIGAFKDDPRLMVKGAEYVKSAVLGSILNTQQGPM